MRKTLIVKTKCGRCNIEKTLYPDIPDSVVISNSKRDLYYNLPLEIRPEYANFDNFVLEIKEEA